MCGGVRFRVTEPPMAAVYCHCKRCQRRTGTAFSMTALTRHRTFQVTEGEDLVTVYDPGDGGWRKAFCSRCGGHLFTSSPDSDEVVAIRMGALDEDPGVRPWAHQFTDYAAPWEPVLDDGLPRFPERADWSQAPLDDGSGG